MKKILIPLLLLCMNLFSMAQNLTTTISGTIINTTTGLPVDNQTVYIVADSSSFNYYNVAYTNPNGFYVDTLTIPHPSQIVFYISTSDCNGTMITNTVVSSNLPMISDFTISCGGNPANCSADFSAYPDTSNTLVYTYYFYDQSVGGAGTITSWLWDFGDGGTCTMQNTTHTFANIGFYNVCLTIATDSGCTATYCDSIYVDSTNTLPCHASFQYTVNNVSVDFYGYSNNSSATYTWDFGDGSSGTGQNVTHIYTVLGSYTVCLTITTSNGCSDTYCATVTTGSSSNGCPASFYAYNDSLGVYTYQFVNTSPGANNGIAFYWDFGDGTNSGDVNPVHTFGGIGTYTVCLHVLDDSTGVILCHYCETIVVDSSNTTGCYAYFGWNSANDGYVYFYDYSGTGCPSDTITSWTWCFGDGSSSTDQNPIHFYNIGQYYVCLAITTASGCSSTYCDYVQVNYIDSSNYCGLYVVANTITYESAPGAADGAIDIDVYGGIPPYTFSWSNGATTEDISGLIAGYYDVVVTDNSGIQGCNTWATFEILCMSDSSNWGYIDTLFTNPIDSCFNFSIGSAYIYSFTFINNTTIEITWIVYDTQGVNHGFVTVIYTFSSFGNYQFTLTVICDSAKSTHVFFDELYIMDFSAGLADISSASENIMLYPNPVTDKLNVEISLPSDMVTVNIINSMGQIISTSKTTYDYSQKGFSINTSSLSKGLYFVQVNNNGQTFTGRFVK